MVKVKSPGPRYALPSTTGYIQHDPTRPQAPAFSFSAITRGKGRVKFSAPGPKYDVRNMNQHGKLESQQTSILGKPKQQKCTRTPGPKSYNTASVGPAYSLGNKWPDLRMSKIGPGPNKYTSPTCIGSHIPDRKAEPAYSILSRNFIKLKQQAPGPKYMLPAPEVYLTTPPRVAQLGRREVKHSTGVPGPNKYNPTPTYEKREALKGISFGVKHSTEKHLVYLPEDRVDEAFVY